MYYVWEMKMGKSPSALAGDKSDNNAPIIVAINSGTRQSAS